MVKQTGIWVDKNEAFLFDLTGTIETQIRHIYCPYTPDLNLEDVNPAFMDPLKLKTGPIPHPNSEANHNLSVLFEKIIEASSSSDEIFLFGLEIPLLNLLEFSKVHTDYRSKIIRSEVSGQIPLMLKVGKVETFFRNRIVAL